MQVSGTVHTYFNYKYNWLIFRYELAVAYLHICKQQSVDNWNDYYIFIMTVWLDFTYDVQCGVAVVYDNVEIHLNFAVQLVLPVITLAVAYSDSCNANISVK